MGWEVSFQNFRCPRRFYVGIPLPSHPELSACHHGNDDRETSDVYHNNYIDYTFHKFYEIIKVLPTENRGNIFK